MQKISRKKHSFLFLQLLWTVAITLIFSAWLILITSNQLDNNTYKIKSGTYFLKDLLQKILDYDFKIVILPLNFIFIVVFLMPIWVTRNKLILTFFFLISLLFIIFNLLLLISLKPGMYWNLWLLFNLVGILLIGWVLIFFITTK